MSPTLALLLWLVLLLGLLWRDPARTSGTSWALWVPVFWMFIMQSRLPSQWLGQSRGIVSQALEEGNPLDRIIFVGIILLSLGILAARSFRWVDFFARNAFLTAFLFVGLVSFLWSDFPFVAFKRWVRDLGHYLVILVVVSEASPLEGVRGFLRRLYYLLIPLSILLIKYYPLEAIYYGAFSGIPEFVGVATSKNTLGAVSMLSGIFFFWDTTMRWPDRKERRTRRILLVNVAFIVMSLWLLRKSNSATSLVCMMLGCGVILAYVAWGRRHLSFFKVALPVLFCGYVIVAFGFGLNDMLARTLGRDPSLTGRTNIWEAVLSTNTNPIIGTGYESFWLGPRLVQVWQRAGGINQAHNGYLELYLNLGIIGLFLLGGLLISCYRSICKRLTESPSLALLALTLWVVPLFHNITEAAFKPSIMCLTFLLGAFAVSQQVSEPLKTSLRSTRFVRADRRPPLRARLVQK